MNSLDILVLSVIGLVAAMPLLSTLAGRLLKFRPSPPAQAAETKAAWQQRWTHTLIELLCDLDRDGMKQAGSLCRELMWEILGGDQGAKK